MGGRKGGRGGEREKRREREIETMTERERKRERSREKIKNPRLFARIEANQSWFASAHTIAGLGRLTERERERERVQVEVGSRVAGRGRMVAVAPRGRGARDKNGARSTRELTPPAATLPFPPQPLLLFRHKCPRV